MKVGGTPWSDDGPFDDGRGDAGPWDGGRRAWERLHGWHQDGPGVPGHPDDAAGALSALADVGLIRRLLDQTELVAVKTARRHRKSWAEIATQLGVTRQSAWERWRDLDDAESPAPATGHPSDAAPAPVDLVEYGGSPTEVIERAVRNLRRSASLVVVPDVIGLTVTAARRVLHEATLVGVGPDPDGPPLTALGWGDQLVVRQTPKFGTRVRPASKVTIWIEGGGAGVREPRRPKPTPQVAREFRYAASDEADS